MRSLRFRLVLGISLIAVVPLAIAIVLLTDRIEGMVRSQAADRVSNAAPRSRRTMRGASESLARRNPIGST